MEGGLGFRLQGHYFLPKHQLRTPPLLRWQPSPRPTTTPAASQSAHHYSLLPAQSQPSSAPHYSLQLRTSPVRARHYSLATCQLRASPVYYSEPSSVTHATPCPPPAQSAPTTALCQLWQIDLRGYGVRGCWEIVGGWDGWTSGHMAKNMRNHPNMQEINKNEPNRQKSVRTQQNQQKHMRNHPNMQEINKNEPN